MIWYVWCVGEGLQPYLAPKSSEIRAEPASDNVAVAMAMAMAAAQRRACMSSRRRISHAMLSSFVPRGVTSLSIAVILSRPGEGGPSITFLYWLLRIKASCVAIRPRRLNYLQTFGNSCWMRYYEVDFQHTMSRSKLSEDVVLHEVHRLPASGKECQTHTGWPTVVTLHPSLFAIQLFVN